jgi:hypothetical protein
MSPLNPLLNIRRTLAEVTPRGDLRDRSLAKEAGIPTTLTVLRNLKADAPLIRGTIWAAVWLAGEASAEDEAALKGAVTALLADPRTSAANPRDRLDAIQVAEEARVALIVWPRRSQG